MNKYTPEQLDEIFDQVKKILMEPQYKLRAIELRGIIDHLYPKEGEISKQDFTEMGFRFKKLNDHIHEIKKCLGIDFKLDNVEPEANALDYIDYNFIQDNLLRGKAIAYYREMLRYQYATRNHKQCFGEFCRLATIQIEYMLNYFFVDNSKIDYIRADLKNIAQKNYENAKKNGDKAEEELIYQDFENDVFSNKDEYISTNIYLSRKRTIFFESFLGNKKIGGNLASFVANWVANMRNRKSHGSKSSIDPYENSYLTKKEINNIIDELETTIQQEISKYNQEHETKIKFKNSRLIRGKLEWKEVPQEIKTAYNKRNELEWICRKPYDEVHQLLRLVASTCARELNKTIRDEIQ